MAMKPVTRMNVSEQVLEQMKDQIIRGRWRSGTKIPSEIKLAEAFGVSRVSVREAIHRLVGMGVLCIRRGEGTFVSELLAQDYFRTLLPILMIDAPSLDHMLEFRAMIEVGSASLAARRAGKEDLARMRSAIRAMERSRADRRQFSAEDLAFHTALAVASHNEVVVKITAIIHDMLERAMVEIVRITGTEDGLHYHRLILDAIERKDEKSAARIMAEHIGVTIEKVGKNNRTIAKHLAER